MLISISLPVPIIIKRIAVQMMYLTSLSTIICYFDNRYHGILIKSKDSKVRFPAFSPRFSEYTVQYVRKWLSQEPSNFMISKTYQYTQPEPSTYDLVMVCYEILFQRSYKKRVRGLSQAFLWAGTHVFLSLTVQKKFFAN